MKFFLSIFGCGHRRMSRVFTADSNQKRISTCVLPAACSYVVCLDCGREFAYDLATMQQGEELQRRAQRPDEVARARDRKQKLAFINQQIRPWSGGRGVRGERIAAKD